MGVSGQRHAPAAFLPGKNPIPHWQSGRLRRRGTLIPSPGFESQITQSVAILYTDWDIPTPEQLDILYIFPENKKKCFKICSVDENYAPLGITQRVVAISYLRFDLSLQRQILLTFTTVVCHCLRYI